MSGLDSSVNTESSVALLPVILNPQSLRHSQLKRKRSPSKEHAAGHATDTPLENKKSKILRIVIPSSLNSGLEAPKESSSGSLFSAIDSIDSLFDETADDSSLDAVKTDDVLAMRTGPPVSGLFFDPSVLLPQEIADAIVAFCMKTYFISPLVNQVMLFERFAPSESVSSTTGIPRIFFDLLDTISVLLKPFVPPETHALLFPVEPTRARQAIINLYQPGEGIIPHVDLLGRYGDGIVGISFSSGCVMRFDKVEQEGSNQERWDVYLPERSMIVMTEDARYGWTHGIDKKTRDLVSSTGSMTVSEGVWIDRGTRMSITFRWLLPAADIVGESKEL